MQLDHADIAYLSASRLVELFARRELSPVEVVHAQIARAGSLSPRLLAFGDCYFEEAMTSAALAEDRWRRGNARALEGVTLAVKDAQNIAGQRTTYGSLAFQQQCCACDRSDDRTPASGGCDCPGTNDDVGIVPFRRQSIVDVGFGAQSLEQCMQPRRIIGRFGGRPCCRLYDTRDGHGYGRLDPGSGLCLRRCRL